MEYIVKASNITNGRVIYFTGSKITDNQMSAEQREHLLSICAIEPVSAPVAETAPVEVPAPKASKAKE